MRGAKALVCPVCRVPLTDDDKSRLFLEAHYYTGEVKAKRAANEDLPVTKRAKRANK
jgi:hypothetical protein